MNRSLSMLLRIWLVHLVGTAILTVWATGVALGLGFKNLSAWTAFDHVQASVVPALASGLTLPGRLFLDGTQDGCAFLGIWVLNSLLWAVVLTTICSGVAKRLAKRQIRRGDGTEPRST